MNILSSLVGAARSFFKTQKPLALETLALRHQVGVRKRTAGNRRLKLGIAEVLTAARSPWESPYVEQLVASPES